MIKITMNTKRHKLTVKGHAMPDEGDQYREICSASGALAQALAFALTRAEEGRLLKSFDYRPDRGDLLILAIPEEKQDEKIEQIFTLYGYGMELLAKSHPCSVQMIWDGEKVIPDKEMSK